MRVQCHFMVSELLSIRSRLHGCGTSGSMAVGAAAQPPRRRCSRTGTDDHALRCNGARHTHALAKSCCITSSPVAGGWESLHSGGICSLAGDAALCAKSMSHATCRRACDCLSKTFAFDMPFITNALELEANDSTNCPEAAPNSAHADEACAICCVNRNRSSTVAGSCGGNSNAPSEACSQQPAELNIVAGRSHSRAVHSRASAAGFIFFLMMAACAVHPAVGYCMMHTHHIHTYVHDRSTLIQLLPHTAACTVRIHCQRGADSHGGTRARAFGSELVSITRARVSAPPPRTRSSETRRRMAGAAAESDSGDASETKGMSESGSERRSTVALLSQPQSLSDAPASLALLLSYDGTSFLGWPDVRDSALRPALRVLLGGDVKVAAASRTDKGVHARGQVCLLPLPSSVRARDLEASQLCYSLNQLLPDSVRARDAAPLPAASGFDPRSNVGKEYIYTLSTARCFDPIRRLHEWHAPCRHDAPPWDARAAASALALLESRHARDFSAFSNRPRGAERHKEIDPFCTLTEARLRPLEDSSFCITLRGDRFLYKMVRNIVGAVVRVGHGELSLAEVAEAMSDGRFARGASPGLTAPAHGLVLQRVFYSHDPFGTSAGLEVHESGSGQGREELVRATKQTA